MLKVGEKAPDFVLKDADGKDVSLKSLLGDKSILLYFYHKDWSPVCTNQLDGFCRMESAFAQAGFRIVAVSADHTFSHKAFREKLGAKYTMLTATKEILEKYDAYDGNFPKRAYFVLDRNGVIRFMHAMPNPGQSIPNEELLKIVKDLKQKMGF